MEPLNSNLHSNLSNNVIKKLTQNRIVTIWDFIQEEVEKLSNITKLDIPNILEIRENIFKQFSAPLIKGTTLLKKHLMEKRYLETGIERLDTILDGGIPTGFISEVCGLAGSGKTQLCMQLAINCVKSSNRTVLYIDSKGDFSACRMQKALEACGLSQREMATIMFKINIVYVYSMEQLLKLLEDIKHKKIILDNLSLVIIDTLPCLLLQHFGDDNKIGLKFLNIFVNHTRYISLEFKLSIVCVNIETRWVDQDQISDIDDDDNSVSPFREPAYLEKKNRCLGKYWQQIPILLLQLERQSALNSENSNLIINVNVQNYNNPGHSAQCSLSISYSGVS